MSRRSVIPALAVIVLMATVFANSRAAGLDVHPDVRHHHARTVPARPVAIVTCEQPPPDVPPVTLDPGLLTRGDAILAVQTVLGVVPLDGVYGPITAAAVTGWVGPADGCSVTDAQQAQLVALQGLQAAQGDLTAQAVARRTAPRVSSGGTLKGNCSDPTIVGIITSTFGDQADHAMSIISKESGCTDTAMNGQGSGAAGLWQLLGHQDILDDVCPGVPDNWANAWCNTQAAWQLSSGGTNWHPWDASGG